MAEQKNQSYLTGAAILAATVGIVKLVGAVYKIPLYNLLGDEGTAHFDVIYQIYSLLLTISTAGVPIAISRLIAEARALEHYRQVQRTYRVSKLIFVTIGTVGTLFMFIFAPWLAERMHDSQVVLGVRVLSPAVLFACLISVYRGYAQGFQNMVPTAVSQIMEVVCKLVIGLAVAWGLSKAGHPLSTVAAGAIVGVTVGLGLSVPVMAFFRQWIAPRRRRGLRDTPKSARDTALDILRISIPITLGASVLNIINVIDTVVLRGRLADAGFSEKMINTLYGVYSKGKTLFHLPSSFITPVVTAVVPTIAALLAKKFRTEAKNTVESCMRVTNLLAMPCAVGLAVLADPIFSVLFPGSNANGPVLLAILGIASYFVCSYSITNGVLQASGHEKLALLSLPVGGLIKIGINYWLVGQPGIHIVGAPVGTLVCYVVITLLNMCFIAAKLPEKPNFLKITLRPLFCTAVMGLSAWGVWGLLEKFVLLLPDGSSAFSAERVHLATTLCLGAAVLVAMGVYFALVIALQAVTKEDILLLPKGEKLARLLKMS